MTPQNATQPAENQGSISECIYGTVVGFLLPFFLAAAGGNVDTADAAIRQLLTAYDPRTPGEIDLAGRIVGFSIIALDNLRLSMTPNLSDNKLLRYRSNAVSLSRASDNARKMLDDLHAGKDPKRDIPRPTVAAAPPASRSVPVPPPTPTSPDLEQMQREARVLMDKFSKNGAPIPGIPTSGIPASGTPTSCIMSKTGIAEAAATREMMEAIRQAALIRSSAAPLTGTRC